MGHGGKYATPPRLNPSPHPQAGRPSGSTYLGNLSNHYLLASYRAQAAGKVDFRWPAPKGACDFEEIAASLKRCPDTRLATRFGPRPTKSATRFGPRSTK